MELINQLKTLCEQRIVFLVSNMSIDEKVKIELQLDEPDSDLINWIQSRLKTKYGINNKDQPQFSRAYVGIAKELLKKL